MALMLLNADTTVTVSHSKTTDLPRVIGRAEVVLRDAGLRELPVSMRHALAIRDLPGHHSDPFDRIQVAQARQEGLTLVTRDSEIRRYDVTVLGASSPLAPYLLRTSRPFVADS